MKQVLFVCTGNIFRSLTAERAVRAALPCTRNIATRSAGTVDYPHVVRQNVRDYLLAKGFDVSGHRRRTLTREIVEQSHLVIAMSTDHQVYLRERFSLQAPLFLEACGLEAAPLPDVEDVVLDYRTNPAAVAAHERATIDRIIELAPRLVDRLSELLERRT